MGCGGVLFAEELAKLGVPVTGIDPSILSIKVADQHARQSELAIDYYAAHGEQLPFKTSAFDIVCCCDVLEHVNDLNLVIKESARVLKPGGVYFYDTINRTWFSKFTVINLIQEWEFARVMPRGVHDWNKFIKAQELDEIMIRNNLEPRDRIGLHPKMDPVANIKRLFMLRKVKRGRIRYSRLAEGMIFRPGRRQFINYMGYSIKKVRI